MALPCIRCDFSRRGNELNFPCVVQHRAGVQCEPGSCSFFPFMRASPYFTQMFAPTFGIAKKKKK